MKQIFTCPVCGRLLTEEPGRFYCADGHSFDRSAKGYVNLLPPSPKGDHGDNRRMIAARRMFLEGGWYAPLLDEAVRMAAPHLQVGGTVLDVGCGEGWYTDGLLTACPLARGFGVDISKDALRFAGARQSAKEGRLLLAAASAYHLPVADGSVDLLWNFFAPMATAEFCRVLAPGGHMLYAVPGPKHLWGLKEILYDIPYENQTVNPALPGFSLIEQRAVEVEIRMDDPQQIQNLFLMTPYAYRTNEAGRARLEVLTHLCTPISFRLLLYRKADGHTLM